MRANHSLNSLVDPVNHGNQGRVRIAVGVGRIQAVDIGENYQQIGVHQVGYQRRQPVVVTKYLPDFVHRNNIVFVEDGDNTNVKQGRKGVPHVQIGLPFRQVINGEQGLCHMNTINLEHLLVSMNQAALPDCCQGLAGGNVPFRHLHVRLPQLLPAGSNSPGSYENNLRVQSGAQVADLPDQIHHYRHIEAAPVPGVGEDGGTDLYDDPVVWNLFTTVGSRSAGAIGMKGITHTDDCIFPIRTGCQRIAGRLLVAWKL